MESKDTILKSTRRYTADERNEALKNLRETIKPGETIYLVLNHVSASGMTRAITAYQFVNTTSRVQTGKGEDGRTIWEERPTVQSYYLNWYVARVLDDPIWENHHDGIKVSRCGMDMGFDLVYRLSSALFGDGYALSHRWL